MIAAHWIQSGLSMPSNEFSFTAVFFANQIEILHRLEAELNHRFNELGTSRVNIAASPFQKDLLAILNLIEIRTDQLNGVVENYDDHELGVTFYKSSEQLKQYISSIRKMSYDVAVRAALKPALARNLQSELRTHLYDLLISLRNLLKFSEQIQKKAKLEWNA